MANQIGIRIRQLREQQNLLLRQIAPMLNMDSPLLSKIERGKRLAKKDVVAKLSKILDADEEELLTLWLADQVYNVVKDEAGAFKALDIVRELLKVKMKQS